MAVKEEIERLHFNHGLIILKLHQGQRISIEIRLVPAEIEDERLGRGHERNPRLWELMPAECAKICR